jgi:hypothetical protein
MPLPILAGRRDNLVEGVGFVARLERVPDASRA